MARVRYRVDFRGMTDLERRLGRYASRSERVLSMSLNRAVRDTRSHISKTAREELNVGVASVNRRLKTQPAIRGDLIAAVVASEKNPPLLSSFKGARWSKRRGVTVQVRKGEGREIHPHTFIRRIHGVPVALRRVFGGGERVGRYPTWSDRGPSVVGLLAGKPGFAEEMQDFMVEKLEQEIDRNVMRQLTRGR